MVVEVDAQFVIIRGVVWTVGLLGTSSPFLRPSGRLSEALEQLGGRGGALLIVIDILDQGRNLDVLLGLLALAWLFRDAEGLGHQVVDVARRHRGLLIAPHISFSTTAMVDVV